MAMSDRQIQAHAGRDAAIQALRDRIERAQLDRHRITQDLFVRGMNALSQATYIQQEVVGRRLTWEEWQKAIEEAANDEIAAIDVAYPRRG